MTNEDILHRIAEALERIAEAIEIQVNSSFSEADLDEEENLDYESWLLQENVPSLTDEFEKYVDDKQGDESIWVEHGLDESFWESKGLGSPWELPVKFRKLVEKVGSNVEKIRKQRDKDELRIEETGIPEMLKICVEWATKHRMNRLSQSNIRAILEPVYPKIRHTTIQKVSTQLPLQLIREEEASIPDMINTCTEWALERQQARLSQSEVKSILMEKYPTVRTDTVRRVAAQLKLKLSESN